MNADLEQKIAVIDMLVELADGALRAQFGLLDRRTEAVRDAVLGCPGQTMMSNGERIIAHEASATAAWEKYDETLGMLCNLGILTANETAYIRAVVSRRIYRARKIATGYQRMNCIYIPQAHRKALRGYSFRPAIEGILLTSDEMAIIQERKEAEVSTIRFNRDLYAHVKYMPIAHMRAVIRAFGSGKKSSAAMQLSNEVIRLYRENPACFIEVREMYRVTAMYPIRQERELAIIAKHMGK